MRKRAGEPTQTWARLHEINPWLFPTVLELASGHGLIGSILRGIPEELLRDANRCPNPWEDLASMRLMQPSHRHVFRACASVLPAAVSMAESVYSRGDLIERVKRATTAVEREALNRKLFPGMWREGAALLRAKAAQAGPEVLAQFEEHEAKLVKMIAKKRGKRAAAVRSDKPTAERLRRKWPVQYLMVTCWLRLGNLGDPGLMFFSDRALADLFFYLDWSGFDICADDFDSEQIEQLRRRLGLRKANEKFPLVTGARINDETGTIEINTSNAKVAAFEWPITPLQLRSKIMLDGKTLYAGIPS